MSLSVRIMRGFKRLLHHIIEMIIPTRFRANWKTKGKNVHIDYKTSIFHPFCNISLGDNVYIGPRALFYCTNSQIVIEGGVSIGPSVSIIAGDHNYRTVGKFIIDETAKLPENDQDVIIEPDVWIGCNVTILKGVTIHRGAVIAAGSIVIKDVPPYAVVAGNPAVVKKHRFTKEEIVQHEQVLYKGPFENRNQV